MAVELPKLVLDLIGDATPNLPPIMGSFLRRGGRVGNIADNLTAVLPRPVNPVYSPRYRAAPNWKNAPSAILHGDLIRTINYNRSAEAVIQLERMVAEGSHNFVVVPKGSRMELRVAPQRGTTGFGEFGVKHVQIAGGKSIIAGGSIHATRSPLGGVNLKFIDDTGTYGKNLKMDRERIRTVEDFIHEMFHYQADNVSFEPFK